MAFKYADEDDEDGIRADSSKPIEIKSGQEIQLFRRFSRKIFKETYFWLEPNDDSYDIVPNPDNRITVPV